MPATVEGEIFFDLGEVSESGTIAPTETTLVNLAVPGDDGDGDGELSVDVVVTGKQLADLGVNGDGERVRVTLSGKTTWGPVEAYSASSLQKL